MWKNKILSHGDDKIRTLSNFTKYQKSLPVLKDPEVIEYLNQIHSKYVLTPIDKASKNIAIICKKFYVNCLMEELGIPGNSSPTYGLSTISKRAITESNNEISKKYLGKTLTEAQKDLPIIYWIPKMHYTPSRKRFIIASSNCSSKPLSSLTSRLFKHIFHQIKNFHLKSTFYSNYNFFWVIENSFPVIERLDEINRIKGAKDISTYDFSTLYTKLPHNDLIRVLEEIIDFVFDGKNFRDDKKKRYLTIKGKKSFWSNKKGTHSYTKQNIKELVSHLIKGCYFQFGNHIFVQLIGIPMGIDPAPFWANLYLYFYEHNHVKELIKSNPSKARKFKYTTRFIDDEGNLNDNGEFGKAYKNIYPAELELKCEHRGTSANFLDLDIQIEDGIFVYKLFDKRDGFPFQIVRMPNLSGNIPDHIFYGSFMAEIIRISRATLRYSDYIPRIKQIYSRMLSQGGSSRKLLGHINKANNRHPDMFKKFNKTDLDVISDISS